jgi:hypothetical protein
MNNSQIVSRIIRFTIVSLILGFLMQGVIAQTKKEEPGKSRTRVEVKIVKEDDKGNVTRIDTTYEVSGDESAKVIVRKIDVDLMEPGDPEEEIIRMTTTESSGIHERTLCCPETPQSGELFPFGMGMTPWGRITKFEIREKKHGKVIRIETNDDGMMVVPPPPPPLPGHMEKKVIRITSDDVDKEGNGKVIIMEKKGKPEIDRNE